jgi:hypothetical protein
VRHRRPLFLGLALVTIGLLFLLRELGLVPNISVWTLLWLALGTWLLVATVTGDRSGWFAPFALIGIGLLMLMRDLELIDRAFAIWPVVVIALGLAMLLDALPRRDDQPPKVWR